jgi:hypothetical protein
MQSTTHTFRSRKILLLVTQSGAGKRKKELRRDVVTVNSFEQLFQKAKRLQRHLSPRAVHLISISLGNPVKDEYHRVPRRFRFEVIFGGYREVEATLPIGLYPAAVTWISQANPIGKGLELAMVMGAMAEEDRRRAMIR